MKKRQAISLLMIVILVIGLTNHLSAQISPGELSKSHAHLEGISNCKKCHELGKKVDSKKCLDCHKEIKDLQSNEKGYHASQDVKTKECFDCHNEHHGRNFEVTLIDTLNFDHLLTGYELVGKHSSVWCKACHTEKNITYKTSQKASFSYLDLSKDCLSCHTDYHQGTLSSNCLNCHTNNGFKPIDKFDHSKTSYSLTGKHSNLSCIKCHKKSFRNGVEFQEFKGIDHKACTSCHEDTHKNKFGPDCKKCHNEISFRDVKELSGFNHSRTNYPLVGKHQQVSCKTCHKKAYTARIAHQKCSDCHTDYHNSQFTEKDPKSDCIQCHTNEGFSPSLYTLEKHQQLKFKLEGAHSATPCFICHKKEDNWNFRNLGIKCIDCHKNAHGTEISETFLPEQNCTSCHHESTWKEINFDHKRTEFELLGKHSGATCVDCHIKTDLEGNEKQLFANLSSHCLECHKDQHNNQFETKPEASCKSCHTYENWQPDLFSHDNSRFKLDGKHINVECKKCHTPIATESSSYLNYKNNKVKCVDCHS